MEGTRALGYVYVAEGAKADLAVQAAAIRRCCHARKLQLEPWSTMSPTRAGTTAPR